MRLMIKHLIVHPLSRKTCSLLIGYFLWNIIGTLSSASISVSIPLSWYNLSDSYTIESPEQLTVTLSGKRSYIRALNLKTLAAHINGKNILNNNAPNYITLTQQHLFLPESIKLVHYTPYPLIVSAHEKITTHNIK